MIPHALHPREPEHANREPPSNTNSNTLTLTQSPLLSCAPWKSVPCESACRSCRVGWRFSGGIFDIDGKRTRIAALDEQTTAADFWNAADRAQKVLREQAQLKSTVDGYEGSAVSSRTPAC